MHVAFVRQEKYAGDGFPDRSSMVQMLRSGKLNQRCRNQHDKRQLAGREGGEGGGEYFPLRSDVILFAALRLRVLRNNYARD